MAKCAFCSHSGTLTREHIISEWIAKLFSRGITARYINGELRKTWKAGSLDWKARVVCKQCNEGWMSTLEETRAKPVMTPLITGEVGIPLTQERAHSIALWAFKTAVVLDHANRDAEPFFSRRLRNLFRSELSIPGNVQMWLCRYGGPGLGRVKTSYLQGQISATYHVQMYVCTCAIGNLAFQVVTVKQFGGVSFNPRSGFEHLSVPLWPKVWPNFVWPLPSSLKTDRDFEAYALRWSKIQWVGRV